MRFFPLFALLLFGAATSVGIVSPDTPADPLATRLDGDWDGTLSAGAKSLRIAFHVQLTRGGAKHARLDFIEQGWFGMPASEVEQTGNHVRMGFAVLNGASFKGAFAPGGRTILGDWTQDGQTSALTLSRHPPGIPLVAQPVDSSFQSYLKPQRLIPINRGRRIHVVCLGTGSPTVILTAGAGFWSDTWRKVQSRIAVRTRTCAWDRAGFGFSDASPGRQDSLKMTIDLERTLKAGRIAGPYIMVGQSRGSYESLLFTDRHPGLVEGMVLVDPSIPGQFDLYRRETPGFSTATLAARDAWRAQAGKCIKMSRGKSADPFQAEAEGCFTMQPNEPLAIAAILARLDSNPRRQATQAAFIWDWIYSSRLLVNDARNYGNMPVIVLTAGDSHPPEAPASEAAMVDSIWHKAHASLAALSTRGSSRVVSGAGHFIQDDKPDVVVAAIDEVLDRDRKVERDNSH